MPWDDEDAAVQQFQVDLRGIVDILSRHLYSSPRVFVRELLQNALDAVTVRRELDPTSPAAVTLTVDTAGDLHVRDTGIGLTADEVADLLATIGRSSKRDEFAYQREGMLGQFGIGLLSCFLVSDHITVRSRSARTPDAPTVSWVADSSGSYRIGTAEEPLDSPGTVVTLSPRPGETWLDATTVLELTEEYGSLLPVAVTVRNHHGGVTEVSPSLAPWDLSRAAGVDYCRSRFGFEPMDAIALDVPVAGVRGVAYVLPTAANPTQRTSHRVYLKRMLLNESAQGLLPDWAYFVRAVVDAEAVRPTASREALHDDEVLAGVRDQIGEQIRGWLVRLAAVNPQRLKDFVAVHQLGVKSIAVHDDEVLALVRDWVPYETSFGRMTLTEFRRRVDVVYYARTPAEYQAVADVASAQGFGLVNGGYVYDEELLLRLAALDPAWKVEPADAQVLLEHLKPLDTADELAARPFLRTARAALASRDCDVVMRTFDPFSVPALYVPDAGLAARTVAADERAAADDLWAGVLDAVAAPQPAGRAQLVLNHANVLVRRLMALPDGGLIGDVVGGLYVQALLAGRHPLRAADSALLNTTFLSLIDRAVAGPAGPAAGT